MSESEKGFEVLGENKAVFLFTKVQSEKSLKLFLMAPHGKVRAEEAVFDTVPAYKFRSSFLRHERKRAAYVKSYIVKSREVLFSLVPAFVAAKMSGKELELGEIFMDIRNSLRSGIVVSGVAAVYEQGQVSLYELIYAEGFGRVSVELLEVGVKLNAVKSKFFYLLYVTFKILRIRMSSSEAVEAGICFTFAADKAVY